MATYIAACRPSVSGEHGHDNAYRIACELVRGFGLTVDDALPFFAEWNQRCEPPWSDRDLLRKLEEADKFADGEPGYLLRGGQAGQQQSGNAERPLTDGVTFDLSGFGGGDAGQEARPKAASRTPFRVKTKVDPRMPIYSHQSRPAAQKTLESDIPEDFRKQFR